MFPPKPLDIVPPEGGWSEGLDAFRFFLNHRTDSRAWQVKSVRVSAVMPCAAVGCSWKVLELARRQPLLHESQICGKRRECLYYISSMTPCGVQDQRFDGDLKRVLRIDLDVMKCRTFEKAR